MANICSGNGVISFFFFYYMLNSNQRVYRTLDINDLHSMNYYTFSSFIYAFVFLSQGKH